MSPYPAQINLDRIVNQARALIEDEGVEHLSLGRLAAALGVKAPSLYRYVTSKQALLRAVNEATARDLMAALAEAGVGEAEGAEARMTRVAQAYVVFAEHNPAAYALLFSAADLSPDAQAQEQRVLPLQALMAQICGEPDSLAALRGALAMLHGFVMLNQAGQFRRGGQPTAAFFVAFAAYLRGWKS